MNNKKLVFFGNERLATGVKTDCLSLKRLVDAGYDVRAVVASFERGTSRNARRLEIESVAKEYSIPIIFPKNSEEVHEKLKPFDAEIGILVAYGQKIPKSIIDLFPKGIINIHPSLLPMHRGSTPIESVILAGETETGVSIMKLTEKMDSGPVYGYSQIILFGSESKQSLSEKLLDLGSSMIISLLPDIMEGRVVAEKQDDTLATYDSLIKKSQSELDFSKQAQYLEREIRAYAGWPKSKTNINGVDLIINEVLVVDKAGKPGHFEINDSELIIFCSSGALSIKRLQPTGKNQMTVKEFLAGYKNKLI